MLSLFLGLSLGSLLLDLLLLRRCNGLGDTTLGGFLRCLYLVADSNTLTGTDELRKIGVESKLRETCHCERLAVTILGLATHAKSNAQNL